MQSNNQMATFEQDSKWMMASTDSDNNNFNQAHNNNKSMFTDYPNESLMGAPGG
jgi:hypothetical protein